MEFYDFSPDSDIERYKNVTWSSSSGNRTSGVVTSDARSCHEYIVNMSSIVKQGVVKNQSAEEQRNAAVTYYVNNVMFPVISLFGIVGNVLNLVVLTRKQLQRSMDRMEKSVSVGLVALAASDMISCILYMMTALVQEQFLFSPLESHFSLYFKIYQEALVNVFLLCSTWLTVNMALGRYFAICHPLQARGFISLRGTRVAVACVFFGSIVCNLPRFWHFFLDSIPCERLVPGTVQTLPTRCDCQFRSKTTTALYKNNRFVFGYGLFCSVVSIFVPLVILTFCNVCLIRALRHSYRMQSMYRANKPSDSGHRITPTLIALIVLFTVLVAPADLVVFARLVDGKSYATFRTVTKVTNLLLLINFAINFVLYCVVNVQFRKTVREIVLCSWYGNQGRQRERNQGGSTYARAAQQATLDTCAISETEIAL